MTSVPLDKPFTPDGGDRVVRLAARGDGVTASGRFVPGVAPGDVLMPDGVVVAGPHRQHPPCPHFGACGGCRLQQVEDAAYVQFLSDRLTEALAAQKLAVATLAAAHLSPPYARRRASLTAERTPDGVKIGYHEDGGHALVDLKTCLVLDPGLFAVLAPLKTLLASCLPMGRRARLSLTLADQGVDLLCAGPWPSGAHALKPWLEFASDHGLARLALDAGEGPEPCFSPTPITITLGGRAVPMPVGAFLQATPDGEAALVAGVAQWLAPARKIADLFAGLGTFALALPKARLAVEGQRDAVAALRSVAPSGLEVTHRDLFRNPLSAAELKAFDGLVLDPPRAGALAQSTMLARSGVKRVAYVSCNPATFARDAGILVAGGYRLEWAQPVGQFRWSTHVELVAGFIR